MHKLLILLVLISLSAVSESPAIQSSDAARTAEFVFAGLNSQAPGARCTRLSYGPRTSTKKKAVPPADAGMAFPGSRCLRLTKGPRKGKILPNTAPKIGLSSSTAYISADAPAEVKLHAIACDAENDTMLYTYSATAGRIQGDGTDVTWNLSGAQPGQYLVTVEVDDGCGCVTFTSADVTVAQ